MSDALAIRDSSGSRLKTLETRFSECMQLRKNNVFVFVCHRDLCWTRLCPSKMNVPLLNPPFFIDFSSHPFADTVGAESPFPILFSRFHFLLFLPLRPADNKASGGFPSPFPFPPPADVQSQHKEEERKRINPICKWTLSPLRTLSPFSEVVKHMLLLLLLLPCQVHYGQQGGRGEEGRWRQRALSVIRVFSPASACPSLHGGFQLKYWVQRKLCFDLHMWKDTTSDVGLCFFSIRDGQRAPHLLTFFD